MGFHKHGVYSFRVNVQRMMVIGGHNFVADITALRRHGPSGATEADLEVPVIAEQYGETAQEAEGRAIDAMTAWLQRETVAAEAAPRPAAGELRAFSDRMHLRRRRENLLG